MVDCLQSASVKLERPKTLVDFAIGDIDRQYRVEAIRICIPAPFDA